MPKSVSSQTPTSPGSTPKTRKTRKTKNRSSEPTATPAETGYRFRLIAQHRKSGKLQIDCNRTGSWVPGLTGLDLTTGVSQMKKLIQKGCLVEDTEFFQQKDQHD